MERSQILLSLATATLLLGGCVYVPPEYYGGPPPPPPGPTPYYFEGPPPEGRYYDGRRHRRGDYAMEYGPRPRGRTDYLREVDPAFAVDESAEGAGVPSGVMSPDDEGISIAPSPPSDTLPAPEKKIDPTSVPYATKTNTPGRAKSPYPQYRELDVAGMKSGSLAKDPTSGKVFRVP